MIDSRILLALGLVGAWVAGYEIAEWLRRRAEVEIKGPVWSRLLTIGVVVFAFKTRTLPFVVVAAAACLSVMVTQFFMWRSSMRAAKSATKPQLVRVASAIESATIVLVLAAALLLR